LKNRLIAGAALVLLGFLLGFVPQYSRLSDSRAEATNLTSQLNVEKHGRRVADFRNRGAQLYFEVANRNFSSAAEQASKFFTDLRQFANESEGPTRDRLEKALQGRDAIVAAIAKADPNASTLIHELFLQLQQV